MTAMKNSESSVHFLDCAATVVADNCLMGLPTMPSETPRQLSSTSTVYYRFARALKRFT